jgi:hypothetical protein
MDAVILGVPSKNDCIHEARCALSPQCGAWASLRVAEASHRNSSFMIGMMTCPAFVVPGVALSSSAHVGIVFNGYLLEVSEAWSRVHQLHELNREKDATIHY